MDALLFENYLYKRAGDEELREISDIEIETLIKCSKIEFNVMEYKLYSEWEAMIREGTQFFHFIPQCTSQCYFHITF